MSQSPCRHRRLNGALPVVVVATLLGAAAVSAVMVSRGGADDPPRAAPGPPLVRDDPGLVHVHGLGINPRDGSLFIATHTGLYRLAKGAARPVRVGDRRQDTMGFTIVGADRFLGSGHPDLRDELPPLLGLIESTDAGRSWRPVSLLAEADFHVLRAKRSRVFGYDVANGRLLASTDGGRSWSRRRAPGPLVDLALHPGNPNRVIAATTAGLYESLDAGRSWRQLRGQPGLLAWPAVGRLYLVSGSGKVLMSRAPGTRWRRVGDIGGEPAALLAPRGRELYAALHDGTVKRSLDGGASWSVRSRS